MAGVVLASALAINAEAKAPKGPKTVAIHDGPVTLQGLIWGPQGHGPFPAILLNHGSGRTNEELERLGPYEEQAYVLGPMSARHGYVFLFLFRRGVGLSSDQGTNAVDLINTETSARGQVARNTMQLQLLEGREMIPKVDVHDVGVIGHSFGGSLTLPMAELKPDLRAVVIFSGVLRKNLCRSQSA